ncbi:c-type cytochrome [Pelodictyon luteolum]|uniref:Cytochrome c-555 n=1 Tax=Chlorobium luteolum (strain DSM 273 / BCRC 81028 / 2530) TaxID=319225 RepID=Q3B6I9_CHLL3|nr:c-type cytochrome [Pelodictyon luteolum]ABB23042.1 cytochrome c-555 [Pelodictyon luteolum DSM 273]
MSRFLTAAFCVLIAASFTVDANAAYNAAAGKAVYDGSCAMCHNTGMAGAPKAGDKTAWASRIGQGVDKMAAKSIAGFKGTKGMMPAKGGNAKLTNVEVGNAVAYMVQLSK